ncbi:MAG: SUMF1/EgtB/PvdO family nonheme iron enzyme, partial [bacterium]|nr:SUMF1/EgtB/PvdO family nonheme iron enzyme [bacterium]
MRGLSCFTFISLFLVASVVADSPFDFRQWTMEGPSANGNWIINDKDGDGVFEQVTQTTNGNITFFVSPNQIGPGNEFKGSFSASSGDDDYIGFVFGFQDASNYYVMQWKQGNQADSGWGNAAAGITILKIRDLDPALDSSNAALWKAVDDAHVKVLSAWTTATGNGVGFQDGVTYNFHLVIQATSVQVRITRSDDGSLVYDSGQVPVDEAVTGRFGFYNLSEEYVVYKGFTFAELPTPTPTPTPRASSTERRTISLPNLPTGARPLEMQLIPAGQFQMGSPDGEPDAESDEKPRHGVTLTQAFYFGKYEITQAQWTAVMGSAPTNTQDGQGPNLPVYDVDPAAIQSFIDKLNTLGLGIFRLPTEAEWEYACRADTTTRFYWGDDPDYTVVDTYAWTSGINQGPAEVGRKKPNPWGLFDMSGNVWEMCQDWYGSYSSGAVIDPLGLGSGDYKVLRGGSWLHMPWQARSARRAAPWGGYRDVGFRIALSPSQQATPTPIPGGQVDGNLIYSNDFESDDLQGWSASWFTVSPNGARRFLGEFDNGAVTLTLQNLPTHRSVTVSFDLLILKSWDGMQEGHGPDIWNLTADESLVLLHTTFDNITTDPNKSQNYPDAYPGPSHPARTGAAEQDTLGYTFWGDSTYRLSYTFPHGASSLQLAFTGMNLQGISDESWGLDDVRVWVSNQYVEPIEPTPTPTPTPQPIVYSAEITAVDVQMAPAGTPVTLRGTAFWLENNSGAANVPVAVRVQRQGITRFLTAVSDGAGQFSVVFTPLAGEAGRYFVNANHPQLIEVDDIPQKEFILVGMRSEPRDVQAHLIPYQPQERAFAVINLGDTPLSGLTARVEGAPANLQATVQIPAELPANGRVDAVLNLIALDNSTPETNFTVIMQSEEEATVTVPVAVTIAPGTPRLSANPGTLQSGMVRGQKTLVECIITNTGGAVAKNVQVMLPQASWLSLVSSSRLGDLAPGQSGTIVLSLQPSPTQKLGLSSGTMIV